MVRQRLKLLALAGLVLAVHVLVLEWIGRVADAISALPAMAPVMYTRMLQPATPPPLTAVAAAPRAMPEPRVHAAPLPKPPASAPKPKPKPRPKPKPTPKPQPDPAPAPPPMPGEAPPPQEEPPRLSEPDVAQAAPPEVAASAPSSPASQAVAAASAPASAASAPALVASAPASATAPALDTWPTDTRLTYQLGGNWRSGPLYGDARVAWQRDGAKYQVRLDVNIRVFGTQVLTSQGEVTPNGLLPRVYEELRPKHRRTTRLGDTAVTLDNGNTVPRPPGVQDTASQFVELSHRFATGREPLAVGQAVTVWLARPGGVDRWTYDIVDEEVLRLPQLGAVPAFHLKPRPIAAARGNITAEMWFAPSLQYLPVRIRVTMGEEAHLDLLVDHIEQR